VRNFEVFVFSCQRYDARHWALVSDCREVRQHVTRIGRDGRQRPLCENSQSERLTPHLIKAVDHEHMEPLIAAADLNLRLLP
jgi:hypothetical protein